MDSPTLSPSRSPVHLDGTTLEGGGQLLRLGLSISSLTCIPVHVTDIRGKRGPKSNPGGQNGGLKPAHLAGAVWLAKATNAATKGMVLRSKELTFRPASTNIEDLSGFNEHTGVVGRKKKGDTEWWEKNADDGVWEDVYEHGKLVRRESHIPMTTPGSVFLVLQAILPYVLFSMPSSREAASSLFDGKSRPVPIRLTIEGGTNAFHSLSYEYASQVLFPMLHLKLDIPLIKMTLHHRGWSMGRANIGSVTFDITPRAYESPLPAFSFILRGDICKFHVSILAPTVAARGRIREKVTEQLLTRYPKGEIHFPVDEDSKHIKRLYLLIVAETSNSYRLGRDWLFDEKIKLNAIEESIDRLVSRVVSELKQELAHGGCVDEYMQDQLVIFQALAEGSSVVDYGQGKTASLHTQTARWVVESILGVKFDGERCFGTGFTPVQRH
ncbi:hypothetical protein MMC06_003524 [Schaereria dolodes]|nr:hypothetical protein [Schaereria dolodes]